MLQQGESESNFLEIIQGCCFETKMHGVTSVLSLTRPSVKDKAEILLQVEELLHIKEELSSQVSYSQ